MEQARETMEAKRVRIRRFCFSQANMRLMMEFDLPKVSLPPRLALSPASRLPQVMRRAWRSRGKNEGSGVAGRFKPLLCGTRVRPGP